MAAPAENAGAGDDVQQALQAITAQLDSVRVVLNSVNTRMDVMHANLSGGIAEVHACLDCMGAPKADTGPHPLEGQRPRPAPLLSVRQQRLAELGNHPCGSLPPEGLFPPTLKALLELTDEQLDELGAFYGEKFEGDTVRERRQAFLKFITHG